MKKKVENLGLIVSETTKGNVKEIKIKRDNPGSYLGLTRLSDVFPLIPHGIVQKDETGMGATTLEIESPRNSIIVEPIKVTASSKAYHHSLKSGSEVLYVGSETKFHPKKVTKKKIQEYINNYCCPR